MADAENNEEKGQDKESQAQQKKGGGKLLAWLLPVGAVVACAVLGIVMGRLFGTRGNAQNVTAAGQEGSLEAPAPDYPETTDEGPSWYYDLDPVIGNLTNPGTSSFIRVAVTLEISGMTEKKGVPFLDQKKPLIRNSLLLYLNSLTAEDVQGEQNLRRMQSQIANILNQNLFPGAEQGGIKQVLFREKSTS